MAVDLTTGTYDADGIFSKHVNVQKEKLDSKERAIPSLKDFRTRRILKECPRSKSIVIEGNFDGSDTPSIVVVEKMPFDASALEQMFTADSRLELKFQNNIYYTYHVYPKSDFNAMEVKVIYNATEEELSKFIDQPQVMIQETPETYESLVSPYFNSQKSSLQWVEDALSGIKGKDKIIFEDKDPVLGFTLIEEPSEAESKDVSEFRATAICQNKMLRSLRDLKSEHIPLLLNIQEKGLTELCKKYNCALSKIETYVCYPPTHFQFHVFFQNIENNTFSIPTEKAYQLTAVISSLQLVSDYYQKVSLTYSLPEKDGLTTKLIEAGILKL